MGFVPRLLEGGELPHRLRDLESPPSRMWLVGALPRQSAVAIVGTRHPTADAVEYTRHLAAKLGAAGCVILSGGAEGIDTAAHEGAISAGAPTVVVAPSAFDRPFPEKNRALFQRIIRDGGGHITAEPPHTPAANPKFFPRNSYLAALAHVLVVVESPIRSGARNAAKWARRLGRPLFVVPAVPWNPHGVGCIAELKLGARPLAGPKDVLRVLSQSAFHWLPMADGGVRTAGCPAPAPPAAPDQQTLGTFITYPPGSPAGTLLAAVSAGAGNVDGIAQRTGLAPTKVEELLLTLAKDGVLVADPSGAVKFVNR